MDATQHGLREMSQLLGEVVPTSPVPAQYFSSSIFRSDFAAQLIKRQFEHLLYRGSSRFQNRSFRGVLSIFFVLVGDEAPVLRSRRLMTEAPPITLRASAKVHHRSTSVFSVIPQALTDSELCCSSMLSVIRLLFRFAILRKTVSSGTRISYIDLCLFNKAANSRVFSKRLRLPSRRFLVLALWIPCMGGCICATSRR